MQSSNIVALPRREQFILPALDEHVTIVGQNGSGKTQAGFWLLSRMPYDRIPYILIDYKREKLFRTIQKRRLIQGLLKPTSAPPHRPGLYLMRPGENDDDAVDDFFWRCHQRARTKGIRAFYGMGFFLDEAYMPPSGKGSAMRAILTQGRSLRLPVIALAQRPVDIDHFFFTEAKHLYVFKLIDREDRRTVSRYAPLDIDAILPRYHAWWYDNNRDLTFRMPPVPSATRIIDDIAARRPPHWWWG